jgi:hypothetical protein
MLIREAALTLTRRRLAEAIPLAQAREREVKATRVPFMILLPTKTNQEIRSNLEDTRQTLASLQKDHEKFTSLEHQLIPLVSYRLETHLRRSFPDYANGLARYRYPADWLRIKTGLETSIRSYHSALKTLLDLCATLAPDKIISTDAACQPMGTLACVRGERLENEVRFINQIADAQRKHTGPAGFTLRRQRLIDWKDSTQLTLGMTAETGCASLRHLLEHSEDMTGQIMIEVTSEQELVRHHSEQGAADYHAEQWAAYRKTALLKINPAELESLAKETETLLESGQFEAWSWLDDAPPPMSASAAAPSASLPPFSTTTPPFVKPQSNGPVLKLASRKATIPPFIPPGPK